jgi:anthranilate phosphoribosyltransferase
VTHTWPDVLSALISGADIGTEPAEWAMNEIMSGAATPAQIAGFLMALRAKGETVEEMRGIADQMLAHANRITVPGVSLDVVGTGGDRAHTVNISTMAAMVCAAAGVRVVKHGNRAASSSSGSADVLEALGVDLGLEPSRVAAVAEQAGITFCFAQAFHPGFRHAGGVRRELGVPTAFNFLGPLTNPAQPTYAAVGVADARMAPIVAGVFASRGRDAAVFRGDDGLDELTPTTTSQVWVVRDGAVTREQVAPEDVGLTRAEPDALRGGDRAHNAEVTRRFLAGEGGPVRDAVLLNAAAALVALDGAAAPASLPASLPDALRAGLGRAAESVDSGAAARALAGWVEASVDLAAS